MVVRLWDRGCMVMAGQEAERIWNFNDSPIVILFLQLEPTSLGLQSPKKCHQWGGEGKT